MGHAVNYLEFGMSTLVVGQKGFDFGAGRHGGLRAGSGDGDGGGGGGEAGGLGGGLAEGEGGGEGSVEAVAGGGGVDERVAARMASSPAKPASAST